MGSRFISCRRDQKTPTCPANGRRAKPPRPLSPPPPGHPRRRAMTQRPCSVSTYRLILCPFFPPFHAPVISFAPSDVASVRPSSPFAPLPSSFPPRPTDDRSGVFQASETNGLSPSDGRRRTERRTRTDGWTATRQTLRWTDRPTGGGGRSLCCVSKRRKGGGERAGNVGRLLRSFVEHLTSCFSCCCYRC